MLEPPVAYRADTPRHPVLGFGESLPIWSCSVWGLPCPGLYSPSGALLPHLFTLTPTRRKQASCGMPDSLAKAQVVEAVSSLWHWPSRSLNAAIPDVIRHTALRSSDFPPPIYSSRRNRQRPPSSLATLILPRLVFHLCFLPPTQILISTRHIGTALQIDQNSRAARFADAFIASRFFLPLKSTNGSTMTGQLCARDALSMQSSVQHRDTQSIWLF